MRKGNDSGEAGQLTQITAKYICSGFRQRRALREIWSATENFSDSSALLVLISEEKYDSHLSGYTIARRGFNHIDNYMYSAC